MTTQKKINIVHYFWAKHTSFEAQFVLSSSRMERQFFFLLITVWTWLWISNFFSCMFKNQSTIRKRQKKEQAKRFCLSLLTFGLACFLLFVFAVVDFKKETRKQTRNVEKKVCGIEKPWHYSKKPIFYIKLIVLKYWARTSTSISSLTAAATTTKISNAK